MLHASSQEYPDDLLRTIDEGTAAVTGTKFFYALVRNLAQALGVAYAFVSEFAGVKTRVRILALWTPSGFIDGYEYDVAGTPCEAVLKGEIRHYPEQVQALFPADRGLVRWQVESFQAIPMMDTEGEVLGHLAVFDTKPMPARTRDMSVFRIFAARATAELLRQQADRRREAAERALRDSEQRLSTLLGSAMDAIIAFDDEIHIVLFNPAAEKVFRCSAEWAKGQTFARFLSKGFRSLLDRYLKAPDAVEKGPGQLWAPEGMSALRADGEAFPVEMTISPMRVSGRRYFTIILRDVNERKRAEQALRRLQLENRYLQEQIESVVVPSNILSSSTVMHALLENLQKVAGGDTTVLLLGETGTGKELLARAIHNQSPRRERLLVKMNCAALPAELIESELFGHEKGAFTGATAQRKGRFELADGGTLFLDEVGELLLPAQAKLLRVLQEQEFERVGGVRPINVDVRVIAATNRDLDAMVKKGEFRADLFYRLNVFPIKVPPLRERREDIPLLARSFLRNLDRKLGKPLTDFSPRALERLLAYHWPGNIRELQNVVERSAILSPGPVVDVEGALDALPEQPAVARSAVAGTLREVERSHIKQVLETTGWVIEGARGAAAILGLQPSTLRARMQKLGIKRPAAR